MIKKPVIITFFGLSLILVFIAALIVYLGLYGIEGPFIIHFNNQGVVNVIGGKENAFNIIIIAAIILIINFILALQVYNRERILSYIFSGVSFIISVFALIAAYLISSVN